MKNKEEVEILQKLIGQLHALHSEISQLAKKSPNDGLNLFKLGLVNNVISSGNALLGDRYKPFADFTQFSEEELPTNSDVAMILAQYNAQIERFRSDNVVYQDFQWLYLIDNQPSDIESKPPTQAGPSKTR